MAYTSADLNYNLQLDPQALRRIRDFINQRRIGGTEPTQNEVYEAYKAALNIGAEKGVQLRGQALQERGQQFSEQMQEKGLALSQDQLKLQKEIAEANKGISQEQMALQEQARQEALQFQREQEESRKRMEEEKFTWEKQRGDTETARYNALVGQQGQQNLISNLMFGGLVLDKTGIGKWGMEGVKDIYKGLFPSDVYGGLPTGDFGAELNYDWGGYGDYIAGATAGDPYGLAGFGGYGDYNLGELNYDWGGYGGWDFGDFGGWDFGDFGGWDFGDFGGWDYGAWESFSNYDWGGYGGWELGGYTGDLIGAL